MLDDDVSVDELRRAVKHMYIEKAAIPTAGTQGASAVVIARGQPAPTSFAVDGTNVYWTTSNCDMRAIADSPQ